MQQTAKRQAIAARKDMLIIGFGAIVSFALAVKFAIAENFSTWALAHHSWLADNLIIVIVLLAVALAIFSLRRWRELEGEIKRRETAEQLLRESEDSYRQIVGEADEIIYRTDALGRFVFCNPAFTKILKYAETELLGKDYLQVVRQDYRLTAESLYKKQFLNLTPSTYFEFFALASDGTEVLIGQNVRLTTLNGQVVGVQAVARDITKRKRSDEIVRQMEEYRNLFKLANDPILILDAVDGLVLDINDKACATYGFAREEFIGRNLADLTRDHISTKQRFDQMLAEAEFREFEETHFRADGSAIDFLINTSLIEYQGHKAILSINRDITERKQAGEEQKILQGERDELLEQLQLQIELMPVAFILSDTEYVTTYWNPAAEKIFGFTRQEVIGNSGHRLIVPSEAQPFVEQIFERIAAGETSVSSFSDNVTKDGRRISCEWYVAPLKKADGKIVGTMCMAQDVTDRRLSELTLRKSEERYRAFVEQSAEAVWCVDIEPPCLLSLSVDAQIEHFYEHGYLSECNDAMAQMFGFSNAAELVGLRMSNLLPKSRPENLEYLKAFIQSDYRLADIETKERDRHRNVKCFLNNLVGIIEEGAIVRAWGTKRDITKRKEAENALHESEERYERLVELSPDAIIVHTDGEVSFCNTAAARIVGAASTMDLIGRSVFDYVAQESRDIMRSRIIRIRNGESLPAIEFKCLRHDGSCVDVEMQSVSFTSGNRSSIQAVIRDVSERKLGEAALQEANERAIREYERLVERIALLGQTLGNARDLTTIFRALRDFAVVSVSCDGMSISLYDHEKGTRRFAYCWADNQEIDPANLTETPVGDGSTGSAIQSGSVIFDTKFQEQIRSQSSAATIGACAPGQVPKSELSAPMIVMGRLVGCIELQSYEADAYREEGTAAMRMAANLVATALDNVSLIEREQLKEEQLRQSQKMEAIGQLAGGVAHDFNNLLTVISGYCELSLRRLATEDPVRKHIEEIGKAGTRAAGLTRQLLAFSRRQILQAKVLDLNSVVRDMDNMLQRLIGEEMDLVSLLKPDLGQIKADPGQIEQVLLNLVVNARDASPNGGKITIETSNAYLDEAYARKYLSIRPGHYVVLTVSDTGKGMDAETQKQIFDPFFTTKEVGKGTGLGLSTVFGIIKQSQGNVWVYSEVGKGTTFKVYLPRVDQVAVGASADGAKTLPTGTETILLVEDDHPVRDLTHEMLQECGYSVITASNGEEGLRVIGEFEGRIDLMITDVVMPKMGGRELAEHLALLRPETRVLYMSGYTDDAIVRHGILDDQVSFIQKPFSVDLLLVKAREVLDHPAFPDA